MPETGSTICYQKYNRFYVWPAEYFRRVLDKSYPTSCCLSQLPSPAVFTEYHTFFPLPFWCERPLHSFPSPFTSFLQHLSVQVDEVRQATFILKTYNTTIIFTHLSFQLMYRKTSGNWVIRHQRSSECSKTGSVCSCQAIRCLCQIPHHGLRCDEAEFFWEYWGRLQHYP